LAADYPIIAFKDASAFAEWLEGNHPSSDGIWIRMGKKGSGIASLSYAEAVEVALCYGWIDGQSKSGDASEYLQKFTPRRKGSIWSKINRDRALALIDSGRMRPSGLAAIEAAKANGRWEAAYTTSGDEPPADWQAALAGSRRARKAWANLDSRNRTAIVFRIQTAKRPETRARRVAEFLEMLKRGEKIYP
jgi:uncharacterized protein YdeI (YjbR/CyaY-like superfamily)